MTVDELATETRARLTALTKQLKETDSKCQALVILISSKRTALERENLQMRNRIARLIAEKMELKMQLQELIKFR